MIRKKMLVLFTILSALALGACGGSSGGGGGGGGGGGLATGTFIKTVDNPLATVGPNNGLFSDITGASGPSQFMYLASDVAGAGTITSISLRHNATLAATVNCSNITIKMATIPTSVTDLVATQATNTGNEIGSEITVVNGAVTVLDGAINTYFDIPLTTPFYYNGVDNLFMEFSRGAACDGAAPISQAQGLAYNAGSFGSPPLARTILYKTKFNFAGGENEQNKGGAAGNLSPFGFSLIRNQNLYLASEINGSGPITGLAYQMNSTSVAGAYTFSLKMGHSTLPALGLTYADNYSDTPVTVATNVTVNIPAGIPAGGWVWIPIPDGVFVYNGVDNLIIDIDKTSGTANNYARTAFVTGSRAEGSSGALVASAVDGTYYHMKFRFNGAPVLVMQNSSGGSSQVLGGFTGTGAGQAQNLYPPSLVGTGGTVTSISVRLSVNSTLATIPNYKIYMGNTAKTTFNIADIYSSNMEINPTLVYSGSFDIPAGLKQGDWVTIPLQNSFTYDPTKHMSILFMADSASPGNNKVSASFSSTILPKHLVGRNNNAVDITGAPSWDWDGFVNVQLNISK
ncbi:MAG TPA: hypothetical protein ENG96_02530 [Gammaproteobacteria bacterium]|nr:hypothetical protein [Gammaproteobacteria bacterium]